MVFSSPTFLFLFLPVVLGIYFLLPFRLKNSFLLAASLIFYFLGERIYSIVMIASIGLNYVCGLLLNTNNSISRKVVVTGCVLLNLLLLAYFKYYNFFVEIITDALPLTSFMTPAHVAVHLPIGISFFTFQALSYVIDSYRGDVKIQKNPLNLALYISLFPQLIAGPIVRYADVEQALDKREHNVNNFAYGIERFVFGLAKKVLIANQVAYYVDKIFMIPEAQLSTELVWLGMIGYALQIFFDFSAYSDMAIGLGRMFGFRFLENFNYPYIAMSIQDFWRRWHISLSTWFRDYVYIPLGGNRHGSFRTYVNLTIVFFLTGLWHGASYNFVVWGLWHGFFLIVERSGLNNLLDRCPKILRSFYVLSIVLIGWVFFRAETLPQALKFLEKMFVFSSNNYAEGHFAFLIDRNFVFVLLIGVVFCLPVGRWAFGNCSYERPSAPASKLVVYNVILVLTFAVSVIFLAAGTYNPFIYFRF